MARHFYRWHDGRSEYSGEALGNGRYRLYLDRQQLALFRFDEAANLLRPLYSADDPIKPPAELLALDEAATLDTNVGYTDAKGDSSPTRGIRHHPAA